MSKTVTAKELLTGKMLDGQSAARIVGGKNYYWQARPARASDGVYLIQQIESRAQREGGQWSKGTTRTVQRCVRPETLLEVVPMTELDLLPEVGCGRKTWKLKKAPKP